MNRRTVLRRAGVVGAVSLAGCLDNLQNPFEAHSLREPIPVEVHNEGSRYYNVTIEAFARETNRQTYDEGYSVRPDERVGAPHLDGIEQLVRVTRYDRNNEAETVEEGAVTEDTKLVAIRLFDDEVVLDIQRRDIDEALEAERENNTTRTDQGDNTTQTDQNNGTAQTDQNNGTAQTDQG